MVEIKNWISGICAVSLMIAILKSIMPESAVTKTFNMTSMLVLIIVVVAPIKKIDFNEFEITSKRNDKALEEKIEKITQENHNLTDRIIEEKLGEYICNRAGIAKESIQISCHEGIVTKVIIYEKNNRVKQILQDECGVDASKISEQGAKTP